MQYVPPLRLMSYAGKVEQTNSHITLPLEAFCAVLRAAFEGPAFEADWYIATYPDVALAIAGGEVPDAVTHFVRFGYFEGRRPRSFDVDVRWYEDTYEDVAQAIKSGAVSDARSHFNANGYTEPRAPTAEAAAAFAPLLTMAAAGVAAAGEPAPTSTPAAKRLRR